MATPGTIQIGARVATDSKVINTDNQILVPAGKTLGISTIVPKTVGNGVYFTPGALMVLYAWNTVTSQSVTFECWYIDPSGNLKQLPSTGSGGLLDMTGLTVGRTINKQQVTLPISGGTIVSFAARISSGAATSRGQTLVKVEIDNDSNGGSAVATTQIVVYGYCYTRKDLTYPSADSIQDPIGGNGRIYQSVSTPAAGAEVSFKVPLNARWRVIAVTYTLAASNAVANRTAFFSFLDTAGGVYYNTPATSNMTASATWSVFLIPGIPTIMEAAFDSNKTLRGFCPLSSSMNRGTANLNFGTTSTNLDVADQWTANFVVEEWIEPQS